MSVLLAAADLDGTLIFSARAAGHGPADAPPHDADPDGRPARGSYRDPLHPVEEIAGVSSAWVTAEAAHDIRALAGSGLLVPVTTRSLAQYERLLLPGPRPRWSVVANGGQLLHDGHPQAWWEARVRTAIAADSVPAAAVLGHLRRFDGQGWVRTVREVDGLFTYLVATARDAVPPAEVQALRAWGSGRGLTVSLQGRKIYLVPRGLTKEAAVGAVVDAVAAAGYLGAGDSLLDAGLLDAAVAGIRPAHGELHAQNWQRPHVRVTRSSGIAAGEEIASWLWRQLAPPTESVDRLADRRL